jgi:hypothetical protein
MRLASATLMRTIPESDPKLRCPQIASEVAASSPGCWNDQHQLDGSIDIIRIDRFETPPSPYPLLTWSEGDRQSRWTNVITVGIGDGREP